MKKLLTTITTVFLGMFLLASGAQALSVVGPITKTWVDPAHTKSWAYIATGGSCAWLYVGDTDANAKNLWTQVLVAAVTAKTATISYVMVGSDCHVTDINVQF